MSISKRDKTILQGLGKKLAEIAALPIQEEKKELWRRLNCLDPIRPVIYLHNTTWHQTGDEIKLETEDDLSRGQELRLRRMLYHWEHMRDDHIYEAKIYSPVVIRETDMGINVNATRTDHEYGAVKYNPVINSDADPSMIPMPEVTVDWEETERNYQRLCDIYDGAIAVEKHGINFFGIAVMDQFIQWRGLQTTFTDMIDRPEWVHAWMDRMTQWHLSRLDQLEELNVIALNNRNDYAGSGGLGFTDELPQDDFDGEHVRAIDLWGFATTQIFSEVSPAMHDEFALTYEKKFLERFGLNTYGCCEPLDKKLDIVKTIPNLRRVSMSSWVDVERGANGLGKDYIFSYKPTPTVLGMEKWNEELARNLLRDALEKTRGLPIEVIMKDLNSCRRESWRMWEWVKMAMELAEEYA